MPDKPWQGWLKSLTRNVSPTATLVTTVDSYDASGRPTCVRDPNGVEVEYAYDGMGQVVTETRRVVGCGVTDPGDAVTTYTYDLHVGHLESITRPEQQSLATPWLFEEDDAHRLTDVHDPVGNTLRLAYDRQSRPVSQERLDPAGNVKYLRTRQYDDFGRLYKDTYRYTPFFTYGTTPGEGAGTITHLYNGNGDPATVTDQLTHVTTYAYDALRRLESVNLPRPSSSPEVRYSYNVLDQVCSIVDGSGLETKLTHGDDGTLLSMASSDSGVTSIIYDEAGNAIQTTDARGAVTTRTFDFLDRLLAVSSSTPATTPPVTLTYDRTRPVPVPGE